jgi:endoglucanase
VPNPTAPRSSGFVSAKDGRVVDAEGREVARRGIGLGNWLLPEGYMWKLPDQASSPRQIESLIRDLLGPQEADAFWKEFRTVFITEADVNAIATAGFDHVRLPINARGVMTETGEPIEAGFALVDQLIQWCRPLGLGVLLDLHGAPGGQTGTNIDDSPNNKPELFMDARYRAQTIQLWRSIATRYRDETTVIGYDLLNEPLPNEWQHTFADDLAELYRDLTAEIRAVDSQHMLVYEGSHWATNWDIFTEVWDDNSMLQFHRYWCAPDRSSIEPYLAARDELGLPIYMGEGGENNPEWVYAATRLYERHNIGWNYWPWKKLDTITSPCSAAPPDGWQSVIDYATTGTGRPSRPEASRIFKNLLDAFRLQNCTSRPEILQALFARPPLVIPAWGFDSAFPPASNSKRTLLRQGEGARVTFAAADEAPAEPNWHHTAGEPYQASERLQVDLETGQTLTYRASASDVGAVTVVGPSQPEDVTVTIGAGAISVQALKNVSVVRLEIAS